jgi:hypothetical protein
MLTGVSLGELGDADVTVRRNETHAFVAVDLLDASRSRVRVLKNRWTVEARGFSAFLNIDGDPSEDNTVLIHKNRGSIGSFSGEGSGIYFQDLLIPPEPGDSTVIVFGNHLEVGSADEPAFSAVEIYGAGRLHVSRNTLRGHVAVLPGLGGGMGIGIDQTTGCRIERNRLDRLETGVGHDLHLGLETSDCVAFVGRHDDVDNDGTNNRIIRR